MTRICFDLLTDGDQFRVGVWVDGVPVWHDGETAMEAFRKAVESVMPVQTLSTAPALEPAPESESVPAQDLP